MKYLLSIAIVSFVLVGCGSKETTPSIKSEQIFIDTNVYKITQWLSFDSDSTGKMRYCWISSVSDTTANLLNTEPSAYFTKDQEAQLDSQREASMNEARFFLKQWVSQYNEKPISNGTVSLIKFDSSSGNKITVIQSGEGNQSSSIEINNKKY